MLPHWIQNDVLVNGVRLHYYRTGKGDKRPLVLVHGFSDKGLRVGTYKNLLFGLSD